MFFNAIDEKLFESACPGTNVRVRLLKFIPVLSSTCNPVTYGIKFLFNNDIW